MFCSGWQKLKACGEPGQLMGSETGCLGQKQAEQIRGKALEQISKHVAFTLTKRLSAGPGVTQQTPPSYQHFHHHQSTAHWDISLGILPVTTQASHDMFVQHILMIPGWPWWCVPDLMPLSVLSFNFGGAGEIVQHLRILSSFSVLLSETTSSGWFTIASDSSSRGADTFWPLWVPEHGFMYTYMDAHMYMLN